MPVSTFSFRISLYVLCFTGQQILVLILTIHMLVETIQRDGRLVSYLSFLSLFLVDVVHSAPLQYPLRFHFLRIQFHGGPLILVSLPYLECFRYPDTFAGILFIFDTVFSHPVFFFLSEAAPSLVVM